MMWV